MDLFCILDKPFLCNQYFPKIQMIRMFLYKTLGNDFYVKSMEHKPFSFLDLWVNRLGIFEKQLQPHDPNNNRHQFYHSRGHYN